MRNSLSIQDVRNLIQKIRELGQASRTERLFFEFLSMFEFFYDKVENHIKKYENSDKSMKEMENSIRKLEKAVQILSSNDGKAQKQIDDLHKNMQALSNEVRRRTKRDE